MNDPLQNSGKVRFATCKPGKIAGSFCFLLYLLLSMNTAYADETIKIAPGLEGIVNEPEGPPKGFVVIAPGAGYDMYQPLMVDAAEAAASIGYRALRFNWRYVSEGTDRGEGIGNEIRDLKNAISYLRDTLEEGSTIDKNIVLIGKSLGSIVAAAVALEDAYPAILLTPICRSADEFKSLYKPNGLLQVMITGDKDPLCNTDILFRHVNRSTKVSIVQGDHGFDGMNDDESTRNRSVVANLVTYWLFSQL